MKIKEQDKITKIKKDYEENIIRTDSCWSWKGMIRKDGYGVINGGGYNNKMLLHRVSWLIHYGEIPKGMYVCHKCDTHICSSPACLFLGTQKDNVVDMISKGRRRKSYLKGEMNGEATISDKIALEVKTLLKDGIKSVDICRKYNLSKSLVSKIKNNKTWKHIRMEIT